MRQRLPKVGNSWSTLVAISLALSLSAPLGAQDELPEDPDVSIVTIEGPQIKQVNSTLMSDGSLWMFGKDQFWRVGSDANELVATAIEQIKTPNVFLSSPVVVGGGSVWVDGEAHQIRGVHRIDPVTGKCIATIPMETTKGALVFGEGALWVFNQQEGTLTKIDPVANQATATVQVEKRKGEYSLTFNEGALWVFYRYGGTLTRIDLRSNQAIATIQLGKQYWSNLELRDGSLWAMEIEKGIVKRIDPKSNLVADEFSLGPAQKNGVFSLKGGSYSLSVGEGSIWLTDMKDSGKYTLARFDQKTHAMIAKLQIDGAVGAPAFWNGSVWLSTWGDQGNYISKINPRTNHVAARVFLPIEKGRTTFTDRGSLPPSLWADDSSLWAISYGHSAYSRYLIRRLQRK